MMQKIKPVVKLSNDIRVGNFSSPHDFTFTDGTILPAVSDEEALRLKVKFIEDAKKSMSWSGSPYDNVELGFELTDEILDEINEWEELFDDKKVDIVLIPLPMLTAMKGLHKNNEYKWSRTLLRSSPFRCIRIEDRTHKLVSINKFCI